MSKQGFASMTQERRKAIAAMGGKAAHMAGTAHEFTSAEARVAGSKGGLSVSKDRAYMSELGRKGGISRGYKTKNSVKVVSDE